MKSVLFFAFLLLTGLSSFAQAQDTIYWNANRKLTWEDFKGRPDKTTNLLAMTQAGIGYEVACNNGELKLKIYCYFNVTKSWTKETDSEELLRHEQIHFDITELYTRMLRKKLSELSDPCGKDIKELDKAYSNIFKACADRQDAYDRESEHSLNDEQQRNWERMIAEELKVMEKYGS